MREAECEKRGPNCRARETAEQEKRDALGLALTSKTATVRAAKLDTEAAEPHVCSTEVKPILTPSRLGSDAIVSSVSALALNRRS